MIVLLTGGSACGKSSYGERLAVQGPKPLYYIAAMKPYDQECLKKIARHQALRKGKGFETLERYTGVDTLILPQRGGTALLECVCNLTANEMYILQRGDMQIVHARVPMAQMFGYATAIRSLTKGRASYSMEPDTFDLAPRAVREELLSR